MIDKIKIVVPNIVVSEKHLGKCYAQYRTIKGNVEKYKLFLTENRGKNDPFLNVEIDKGKNQVSISGSLRKWKTSKSNALADLTKENFDFCLKKIGLKLDIPLKTLYKGTVTQVEIGASIKMNSKYRYILSCIDNFPKLKRETYEVDSVFDKNSRELETLYFRGTNFSLMFYNKLEEVFSPNEKSKKALSKLTKTIFVLRYEIKVKKVSGYILKEKLNSIEKIRENWNEIIDHWVERLNELTFIDNLSVENVHFKEGMNLTELKELLMYQGMNSLGWKNVRVLVNDFGVPNKVSDFRKELKRIWEKNRGIEKRDYPEILKSEILIRGGKLRISENP